jgi:hypothetical protein
MALLFMDSFDHYVTADFIKKWQVPGTQGPPTISVGTGRHGSNAYRANATGNAGGSAVSRWMVKALPASGNVFIAGFSFTAVTLPFSGLKIGTTYTPNGNDSNSLISLRVAGIHQVWFRINTNGSISVLRGSTILGTTTNVMTFGVSHHIQVKVFIDPAVGTVDLLVNGLSWLSLTAQNTRNAATVGWDDFLIGGITSANTAVGEWDFDDLWVCDGSGAAPWNDFLGDCRCDVRVPTAEGASSAWTPLSGTDNALMVDEAQENGDTDYNATNTVGAVDTFVTQDAPVVGGVVLGVQHNLSMRKVDAGVCTLAHVIRHSGVDYVGAAFAPSVAYNFATQMAQVNPGTGAQWTEAGFNAAEFGYKRVS